MEKSKKIKIAVATAVAIIIAGLSFGIGFYVSRVTQSSRIKTLESLMNMIDENYVNVKYNAETGEYETVEFSDSDYVNAIVGMLDPYSDFFTSSEYKEYIEQLNGVYLGIGTKFLKAEADKLIVYDVAGNSPAEKAGIKVGDKLVKAVYAGTETVFTSYDHYKATLASVPQSTAFSLYVEGKAEPYIVSREAYVESYVWYKDKTSSYSFLSTEHGKSPVGTVGVQAMPELDENTAYIKFGEFNGEAGKQFGEAMTYLRARGKSKLVLDLRGNGGGLLSILQEVAEYLITDANNSGSLLVSQAQGKNGFAINYKTSQNKYQPINIAVLADSGSASATESLIGAMLSYGTLSKSNLIITKNADGSAKTYGKGIMQSLFFDNGLGFVVKQTAAIVYWPDGTCIHSRGIETTTENGIENQVGTDAQLNRALEVLNG